MVTSAQIRQGRQPDLDASCLNKTDNAKQIMDKSTSESFYSYPELESIRLLFELMADPAKYNVALESFVARVTSRLAWGTSAPADELKQRARELLIGVSPAGALGNKLPVLMSLPECISPPKAWEARRSRTEKAFFETMQEEVKQSMAHTSPSTKANSNRSWMSMFLEHQTLWGFSSPLEGAYAVGMHGIAGALTIAAPMQSFCLALCHYPQYQPILHEEIERVLGDRMPSLSDMPDMPVLRAFIRETLRWRPAVPTGIPHTVIKDDIYNGYHIPAGSTVHAFEWSISRDPEVFIDPDAFNPLRWLDSSFPTFRQPLTKYPTISNYSQFGYGRRTCQGMGVVDADLFVGLGSVAWLFSIHAEPEAVVTKTTSIETSILDYRRNVPSQLSDASSRSSSNGSFSSDDDQVEALRQNMRDPLMSLDNDSAICISGDKGDQDEAFAPLSTPADTAQDAQDYASKSELCGPLQIVEDVAATLQQFSELPATSKTTEHTPEPFYKIPGSYDFPEQVASPHTSTKQSKGTLSYENDPTMNFSTLLIAKPMPFKFQLRIRSRDRAEYVAQQWIKKELEGEFQDSKVYWKNGTAGDAQCG